MLLTISPSVYIATVASVTIVPVKSSRIVFPPVELLTPRIVMSQTLLLLALVEFGQLLALTVGGGVDLSVLLSSMTFVSPLPCMLMNTFPCAVPFIPTH
jgi:hypothetical protein